MAHLSMILPWKPPFIWIFPWLCEITRWYFRQPVTTGTCRFQEQTHRRGMWSQLIRMNNTSFDGRIGGIHSLKTAKTAGKCRRSCFWLWSTLRGDEQHFFSIEDMCSPQSLINIRDLSVRGRLLFHEELWSVWSVLFQPEFSRFFDFLAFCYLCLAKHPGWNWMWPWALHCWSVEPVAQSLSPFSCKYLCHLIWLIRITL